MTPSIDQTLHQFANLLPNWTLIPILTLWPNFGGFHRTLQRVRLANRGRLLLRTPGPVPFGTCVCSDVETILSWTCHIGPSEFRTSLGTSVLHFRIIVTVIHLLFFIFQLLKPLCLAKDYWWGLNTQNAHMIHIKFDLKWCIHLSGRILYFNYFVSVTAGGPVSPGRHM